MDSEDSTIEAVELPGRRFVLAVQWHPEDQAPENPEQRWKAINPALPVEDVAPAAMLAARAEAAK